MSRATPQMRHFAQRLMAYEMIGSASSDAGARAAFSVCEKLRLHLATMMGKGGFRALLARALVLAHAEVPGLRAVQVKSDGTLEGLELLHAELSPADFFEGEVVLVAQLLGLLVAFIGEQLTVRLVREIWPRVSVKDLGIGNDVKNEKTN